MSLKTIGTIQQSESEKGDHDKESTKNNVIQTHLTMLKCVLAAQLARFENKIDTKEHLQALRMTLPAPSVPLTRSASQPELRKQKNLTSQSQLKTTQKSLTAKPGPSQNSGPTKKNQPKAPPAQPTPKPVKQVKHRTQTKNYSSKLKKKIQKIPEVRKDISKKRDAHYFVDTAEMPRMRLGDKEKKKIRRLLLLRQVKTWVNKSELKREGRELRNHI